MVEEGLCRERKRECVDTDEDVDGVRSLGLVLLLLLLQDGTSISTST